MLTLYLLFKLFGLMISWAAWFLFRLPVACMLFALGLMLCCTVIGIPAGLRCFSAAGEILLD